MLRRAFLSSAFAATPVFSQSGRRPNFIVVLADDLGWRDLGCYGHPYHETPNLDALAAESLRFTQAYAACPVCSPARASLMTGRYPARLHLTDWIPGRGQWPASKLLTVAFEQQLPLAETILPEILQPLGYHSASIGKWHLGGEGFSPANQGFDINIGGDHRGSPPGYFGPFDLVNLKGGTKADLLTDRLTEEAVRFIDASAGKPFLLYLPHYAVHTPIQAPDALSEKYRRKMASLGVDGNPTYAAMVETLDQSIGRLREKVKAAGLENDTVWFFTSDNGGLRFEGKSPKPVTDNAPARNGKGHLYEGGIRVPLLIRWPGATRGGSTSAVPVTTPDLFATILDIAGARPRNTIDGRSLTPLLRGVRMTETPLFWHYPHYSNQGGVPAGAVRDGEWKLIEFYEDARLELYHLPSDPSERLNLVNKHAGLAKQLRTKLDAWRKSVNAIMPRPNPSYDPAHADQGLTGAEKPVPPIG
ncbi:MAG: sulfatase [Acidobacteria bacterium]|nr:sulfatase [Acidobacteriota bacterium]